MVDKYNGGPAFPVPDIDGGAVAEGMSLRDYFAAKAMQGFATNEYLDEGGRLTARFNNDAQMARTAYEWADALLKAREA